MYDMRNKNSTNTSLLSKLLFTKTYVNKYKFNLNNLMNISYYTKFQWNQYGNIKLLWLTVHEKDLKQL